MSIWHPGPDQTVLGHIPTYWGAAISESEAYNQPIYPKKGSDKFTESREKGEFLKKDGVATSN